LADPLKITRRKFIGLAAAVALLPTGLIDSKPRPRRKSSLHGTAPQTRQARKTALKIYVDESGGPADSRRIAGCLIVSGALTKNIKRLVRASAGDAGELRWQNVARYNGAAYRNAADTILSAIDRGQIDFKYSIVESSSAKWAEPRTDIGYSAGVDDLLKRCAVEYRNTHKLYVYPQRRRAAGSSLALREQINRAVSKGRSAKSPVRLIEYRDPVDSVMNQVVDVLVGAVAYKLNARGTSLESEKRRLSEYIASRLATRSQIQA
jgi:hypothetical protein